MMNILIFLSNINCHQTRTDIIRAVNQIYSVPHLTIYMSMTNFVTVQFPAFFFLNKNTRDILLNQDCSRTGQLA